MNIFIIQDKYLSHEACMIYNIQKVLSVPVSVRQRSAAIYLCQIDICQDLHLSEEALSELIFVR